MGRDRSSHRCYGCGAGWLRCECAEGGKIILDDISIEHLDNSDHFAPNAYRR